MSARLLLQHQLVQQHQEPNNQQLHLESSNQNDSSILPSLNRNSAIQLGNPFRDSLPLSLSPPQSIDNPYNLNQTMLQCASFAPLLYCTYLTTTSSSSTQLIGNCVSNSESEFFSFSLPACLAKHRHSFPHFRFPAGWLLIWCVYIGLFPIYSPWLASLPCVVVIRWKDVFLIGIFCSKS